MMSVLQLFSYKPDPRSQRKDVRMAKLSKPVQELLHITMVLQKLVERHKNWYRHLFRM
jgi:hypothetical protein